MVHVRVEPGLTHDLHGVLEHVRRDVRAAYGPLGVAQLFGGDDGREVLDGGPLELLADDGVLVVRLEVAQPEPYGEPVELRRRATGRCRGRVGSGWR